MSPKVFLAPADSSNTHELICRTSANDRRYSSLSQLPLLSPLGSQNIGSVLSLTCCSLLTSLCCLKIFSSQPNTCTLYHLWHNLISVRLLTLHSLPKLTALLLLLHSLPLRHVGMYPVYQLCFSLLLRITGSYVGLHRYSKHRLRSFSKFLSSSLSSIAQQVLIRIVFNAMPWLVLISQASLE